MQYYPGVSLEQQLHSFRTQYLERKGWHLSFEERASRDAHGPVPWFTYPALAMLERMIRPGWQVFEYGGGSSTIWFSNRCSHVITVEHDAAWAAQLEAARTPRNIVKHVPDHSPLEAHCTDFLAPFFSQHRDPNVTDRNAREFRAGLMNSPFQAYAAALLSHKGDLDVVVVDGMARVLCTWVAVRRPTPPPLIVFDNSDRCEYESAFAELRAFGYRRIDFWGPGPMNPYEWCTSLFVRSLDLLPS